MRKLFLSISVLLTVFMAGCSGQNEPEEKSFTFKVVNASSDYVFIDFDTQRISEASPNTTEEYTFRDRYGSYIGDQPVYVSVKFCQPNSSGTYNVYEEYTITMTFFSGYDYKIVLSNRDTKPVISSY